jgi:hypothetical protein
LSWQGKSGGCTLTVSLASKGAGGQKARLQGLTGAMRVEEVLRLSAAALGVPAGADAALRSDSRVLRGDETLAEAGAGELSVAVGVAGGMPGFAHRLLAVQGWHDWQEAELLEGRTSKVKAFIDLSPLIGLTRGGQQKVINELRARVREAETRALEEARRRAEAEAEVENLRLRSGPAAPPVIF